MRMLVLMKLLSPLPRQNHLKAITDLCSAIPWQQLSRDKPFSALPERTTEISHSGRSPGHPGDQQDTEQI